MSHRVRLDLELVRRGLAGSREAAQEAIGAGNVIVRGVPARRAAALVSPEDAIALAGPPRRFVSRGGEKLDAALRELSVDVAGRPWMDAGASTGGFTDRLLQGGATAVIAVDVGYGQLDLRLREDPRVVVLERTNIRYLGPADVPFAPEGIVADLSFISLRAVLPALATLAAPDADLVLLVKPQFEVGRDAVGPGGVVRDPRLWRSAVGAVAGGGRTLGLGVVGAVPSRIPGPAGNREFFIHLRAGAGDGEALLDAAVADAP